MMMALHCNALSRWNQPAASRATACARLMHRVLAVRACAGVIAASVPAVLLILLIYRTTLTGPIPEYDKVRLHASHARAMPCLAHASRSLRR